MLLSSLLVMGCAGMGITLGTKKETEIVHTSITETDDRQNSTMKIATNKPIPVTVGDEVYTEKDLGGYVPVHPADMTYFLDLLEAEVKRQENRDQ